MTNWDWIEEQYNTLAQSRYVKRPHWQNIGEAMLNILPQLKDFVSQHIELVAYLSMSALCIESSLTGITTVIFSEVTDYYEITIRNQSNEVLGEKLVKSNEVIWLLTNYLLTK